LETTDKQEALTMETTFKTTNTQAEALEVTLTTEEETRTLGGGAIHLTTGGRVGLTLMNEAILIGMMLTMRTESRGG
jgi:hypothetical protein